MPYGQYRQSPQPAEPVVVPVQKGPGLFWLDASDSSQIVSQSGNQVTEVTDKFHGLPYRSDNRAPGLGGPDTGTATLGGLNAFEFTANEVLRSHILSGDPPAHDVSALQSDRCMSYAFVAQTNNASSDPSSSIFYASSGISSPTKFRVNIDPATGAQNRIIPRGVGNNNRYNILGIPEGDILGVPSIFAATITLPSVPTNLDHQKVLHRFEFNGISSGLDSTPWNNDGTAYDTSKPVEILFGGSPQNSTFGNPMRPTERWYGLLGEFLCLRGYWSPSQMSGYLAHKWSLQSLLPADHPYKTVSPVMKPFA